MLGRFQSNQPINLFMHWNMMLTSITGRSQMNISTILRPLCQSLLARHQSNQFNSFQSNWLMNPLVYEEITARKVIITCWHSMPLSVCSNVSDWLYCVPEKSLMHSLRYLLYVYGAVYSLIQELLLAWYRRFLISVRLLINGRFLVQKYQRLSVLFFI